MAKSMEPYRRSGRSCGAGWYVDLGYVKLPDGSRRRFRSLRCEGRTKEQARDWAYQERARLAEHGTRRPERGTSPTVDDLFPLALERGQKVGGSRGRSGEHWVRRQRVAYCGTRGDAGWIRPHIGDLPVTEVSARHLDRLVMEMHDAGRAPKTIVHTLQVVRGILDLARRHGHITELPEFPTVRTPRPSRTAYRYEEAARVVLVASEFPDPQVPLFVLLGFHAGLYQEEIMGLERDDVDLDVGCIHIRRSATDHGTVKPLKTENRVRDIPLTPALEAALRAYLPSVPVGVPQIFFRRAGSQVRRLKKEWIRWPVRSVFEKAGLPVEEPFRRMRRTFCTEAKQRVPEVLVTRWMGHADRNVTDRHYVGEFPMEYQRQMIALLEEPVLGPGGPVGAIWEPVVIPGRGTGTTARS